MSIDEIARSILSLVENDQSSFTTGQSLVVDGSATAILSSEYVFLIHLQRTDNAVIDTAFFYLEKNTNYDNSNRLVSN
jgi:hypothetical protein